VEREQRLDILVVIAPRALGEVALVRQVLEIGPEQFLAGSDAADSAGMATSSVAAPRLRVRPGA